MDSVLPRLLASPPAEALPDVQYHAQCNALITVLNQINPVQLTTLASNEEHPLTVLDPSRNTISYLFTLLTHIQQAQALKETSKIFRPGTFLWTKAELFFQQFDPIQVRYVGPEWKAVLDAMHHAAEAIRDPSIIMPVFGNAILRLDPASSCFTSTHSTFILACLEAHDFSAALPVLDKDIYHLPASQPTSLLPLPCAQHETSATYLSTHTNRLSYRDYLKYYLYGAMIYIAVKNYERALYFLEICMSAPVDKAASMIQVEAYKKWIIVSLLQNGQTAHMSSITHLSQPTKKTFSALAKAYESLASHFTSSYPRLHAEYTAGIEIWSADQNLSLVNLVLRSHRIFAVQALSKTYAALPVSAIAETTSSPPSTIYSADDTEAYLEDLIAEGKLKAELHRSGNGETILRFSDSISTKRPPSQTAAMKSESEQYEELLGQSLVTEQLARHIREAERKMVLSQAGIEAERKARREAKVAADVGDAAGSGKTGSMAGGGGGGRRGPDSGDMDWPGAGDPVVADPNGDNDMLEDL
ncbi:hypothetical protein MMC25_003064 [Agyrium rufum]|nr:hypothetical protein [Agyrium rufum]